MVRTWVWWRRERGCVGRVVEDGEWGDEEGDEDVVVVVVVMVMMMMRMMRRRRRTTLRG